jgi:ABC-type nitrate/sulfonate/bicarbonate transport system permease component
VSRLRIISLELIGPVAVLLAWFLITQSSHSFYLATLGDIWKALRVNWLPGGLVNNGLPSLYRFLIGYGLACLLGAAGGLLIGLNRWLADALDPIVQFLRALPAPVLIPFGILVLGIGDGMKIAIIAFGAVWPVLLNTIDGVRSVDPTLLDTARAYQMPVSARVRRVIVPATLPQVFAGMRTSLSIALALMVISEMLASTDGIGYFVLLSQRQFQIPAMWSGIVVIGVLGFVFNILFLAAERRALRWHAGLRGHIDA